MLLLAAFDDGYLAKNISSGRRAAYWRLLTRWEAWLGKDLADASADDLAAFVASRINQGYAPNTARNERNMLRAFYEWGYRPGEVGAETLIAMRSVKAPAGSTNRANPKLFYLRPRAGAPSLGFRAAS